jgi:putative nucleotidyltransferase with HDIG domain
MNTRHRPSLNLELMPSAVPGTVAHHAARWSLLVALALLTFWLFPIARGFETPLLASGDVSQTEVIAPFAFAVPKTPAEIDREAVGLEATVRPIYEYRGDIVDSVLMLTDSLFARLGRASDSESVVSEAQGLGLRLSSEDAQYLLEGPNLDRVRRAVRRLLSRELRAGAVDPSLPEQYPQQEVVVRREGTEGVARRDTLRTTQGIIEGRFAAHPDPNSSAGDVVFTKLIAGLFRATLVPNEIEFAQQRLELRNSVNPVKDSVRADERIIDANEVVTDGARDRLVALRQEIVDRGLRQGSVTGMVGQILSNGLLLSVFWLLLLLYRPQIYDTFRQLLTLSLLFALVIIGSWATASFIGVAPEFIPVPFAAMLITVMFRGRVAMVAAMVLAVLIGSQAVYGGSDALLIALLGGVAAAISVRSVRRRNHLLTAAAWVVVAYLMGALTVGLRLDWSVAEIGLTGLRGGLNGIAAAALVSALLPLFERLSGVTTDMTLLELSDPDRSLLRRLASEAPGTYAHSIAMANLCEAACNAVGAQGLLARVGCYYHDIGKLKKPQYFVENQSGSNPHDKLKPEASAGIVRNHVRDGLQMADEKKLPDLVKAFIAEHHGTMEITYFLDRARQRADNGDEVKAGEYRYPGPKPQSVETAVAMLADGVEAAVRVLDDPTAERLGDAIDHIVQQRVDAGQLEEAPLTMAQLARVRDEFARVIGGVYHNRIDYPATSGGIGADWEASSRA